jgi:hypothetical protein
MTTAKKILYPVAESEAHCDFMFWCPGCQCAHGIWTTKRNSLNAVWTFNGDMEKPTFAPSLLIKSTINPPVDPATNDFKRGADGNYLVDASGKLLGWKASVCHSFIRDGQIEFLSDCTHAYAGKTIPMEAF